MAHPATNGGTASESDRFLGGRLPRVVLRAALLSRLNTATPTAKLGI